MPKSKERKQNHSPQGIPHFPSSRFGTAALSDAEGSLGISRDEIQQHHAWCDTHESESTIVKETEQCQRQLAASSLWVESLRQLLALQHLLDTVHSQINVHFDFLNLNEQSSDERSGDGGLEG